MQAEHPAQTCREKRRETVFFDLDDTLYDRAVPYLAAFRQFFGVRYEDRAAQAFDAVIRRGEAPGTPRPDYTAGSEQALLACLREISEQDA